MVKLHVNAAFGHEDAFGFEEFSLKRGVRLADEKLPICTHDAMPGNAFSGGAACHGAAGGSGAAGQAQGFSDGAIRNNPPPGNLFHEPVDRIPGHTNPSIRSEIERARAIVGVGGTAGKNILPLAG